MVAVCQEHGQQRAALPIYSLALVIAEYAALRESIIELIDTDPPLSAGERSTVMKAIDQGISQAAIAFTEAKGISPDSLYRKARADAVGIKAQRDRARVERDESRTLVSDLESERELRDKFVATLSHDLRNPLSAARASADLILRTPNDCGKHPYLAARIQSTLDRADRMITNLLDASRIRTGQDLPLSIEECELKQLVTETLEELATVHGNRFQLQINAPMDAQFRGYWSPNGIKRILENLITNAVKYGAAEADILVSLSAQRDLVQLSVQNSGNPLTQEEQAALFKSPASGARVSGKPGWGLGLTVVRGISEAHGGGVSVESSAQAGTTFTVTLPRDARPFRSAA